MIHAENELNKENAKLRIVPNKIPFSFHETDANRWPKRNTTKFILWILNLDLNLLKSRKRRKQIHGKCWVVCGNMWKHGDRARVRPNVSTIRKRTPTREDYWIIYASLCLMISQWTTRHSAKRFHWKLWGNQNILCPSRDSLFRKVIKNRALRMHSDFPQ